MMLSRNSNNAMFYNAENIYEKRRTKKLYFSFGVPRYFNFDREVDLKLISSNSSAQLELKNVSGRFSCILTNLKGQENFSYFLS